MTRIFFIIYIIVTSALIRIYASDTTDAQFIIDFASKVKEYNEKYLSEKVFIHTDKDIYQPGEILWFKAYINESSYNIPSILSKKLFVKLIGNDQEIYYSSIFEIEQGKSVGNIIIPQEYKEKNIYLVAYSSWMTNGNQPAFIKEIEVKNKLIPDLLLKVVFKDTSKAQLSIAELNNLPVKDAKYNYSIQSKNKIYIKGSGTTNENGNTLIQYEIPRDAEGENLFLDINVKWNGRKENIICNIPRPSIPFKVSFFPEAGNIILGLDNKVGYKVTDKNNNTFNFEGVLYDNDDKEILNFSSLYNGSGYFSFKPEDKTYYIKITKPIKTDTKFYLPEIKKQGIVLTYIGQLSNRILLMISKNSDKLDSYYIIAHVKGQVLYAAIKQVADQAVIEISKKDFPIGLAQILIFNINKELVAKRNVFIKKNSMLKVNCKTNKTDYACRENVKLNIDVTDGGNNPIKGNFSISVIDKTTLSQLENIAASQIFYNQIPIITKDFQPDFLLNFNQFYPKLETILLTNVFNNYDIEYIMDYIESNEVAFITMDGYLGKVTNNKGQIAKDAKVVIFNKQALKTVSTFSDEVGEFYVPFNEITCSDEFLEIEAFNPNNNQKLIVKRIDCDHEKIVNQIKERISAIDKSIFLDTITTNYNSLPGNNYQLYSLINFQQQSSNKKMQYLPKREIQYSQYHNVLDIIKEIKYFTLADNKIIFPGCINSLHNQQGALIVIDGMMFGDNISVLNNLPTSDIKHINVSTTIADVQRYSGLYSAGMVEIETITGENTEQTNTVETEIVEEPIIKQPNSFESPDYSKKNDISVNDLRTTIYWNPNIEIDENGITEINFYNGDIQCEVLVIIQGINNDGSFGYVTFNYKVE